MRIFLGGHLNFYHPHKDRWLEVTLECPKPLTDILDQACIPLAEVQLVAINGEVTALQNTMVTEQDEVKVFSAVGGG
jgi:sulfur carrier protein ThiS